MHRALITPFVPLLIITALPMATRTSDEFTNLQVLAKDTSKPELVGMTRGLAGVLGMDFTTAERAIQQTAPRMIQRGQAIHGQHLAGIETKKENDDE